MRRKSLKMWEMPQWDGSMGKVPDAESDDPSLIPKTHWSYLPWPTQALCHHWPSISCGQDTIVDQRVCGWFGVYISRLVALRVPSCTKDDGTQGWRLHVDTPAWLLRVQWIVWVSSSAMWACYQFVESNLLSWQASFGDKRWSVATLSPPLFVYFI